MMDSPRDDAPGRLTPYELVFSDPAIEAERFPTILREAEDREADVASPDRFLMLASTGALLREMITDASPPNATGERRPEDAELAAGPLLEQIAQLLFQAFNFWRFGRRLIAVDDDLVQHLIGGPPSIGEWDLAAPHPAGYLQLPRHRFWSRVDDGSVAEPVDGFFWTLVGQEDPALPPYTRLDVLLVLGMRPGRPGLSVIPVGIDLAELPEGSWAEAEARPGEVDFANVLPGGELKGYRALATPTEVLKLLSLLFWYAARHPDALSGPHEASPTQSTSSLPHYRLHLSSDE